MHYVFASIEFGGYGGSAVAAFDNLVVLTGKQVDALVSFAKIHIHADGRRDVESSLGFKVNSTVLDVMECDSDKFVRNIQASDTKRAGTMVMLNDDSDSVCAVVRLLEKPTKARLRRIEKQIAKKAAAGWN